MSRRLLVGVFEREEDTLTAIRASRSRGFKVVDVYGPYAVHGVEDAMGLSPSSRIPWVVFLLGLIGAALRETLQFSACLRAGDVRSDGSVRRRGCGDRLVRFVTPVAGQETEGARGRRHR